MERLRHDDDVGRLTEREVQCLIRVRGSARGEPAPVSVVVRRGAALGVVQRAGALFNGVELVVDRESKTPDRKLVATTVYRAFELGVVVYYIGGNVLEVTPPLVITDAEVDRAVEIIGTAIDNAAAGKVPADVVATYAGW